MCNRAHVSLSTCMYGYVFTDSRLAQDSADESISIGDSSFAAFTLEMVRQLMQDEETRSQHQVCPTRAPTHAHTHPEYLLFCTRVGAPKISSLDCKEVHNLDFRTVSYQDVYVRI